MLGMFECIKIEENTSIKGNKLLKAQAYSYEH